MAGTSEELGCSDTMRGGFSTSGFLGIGKKKMEVSCIHQTWLVFQGLVRRPPPESLP